ncbi:MAG: ornithine cyclodeaminase family protein [Firmicutes bacterium]|nr:ornithine cyclodeaminase family protein [Bacillota bacterium]
MSTRIISGKEAAQLLTMQDCIDAMKKILVSLSYGKAEMLQRNSLQQENGNSFALMPGCDHEAGYCGVKAIVFPGPGIKTSQGIIPLFDAKTGALTAIVDANHITDIRTGATSAAATDMLARKDAHILAVLGAGRIGRAHLAAIPLVRDITEIRVWDQFPEAAKAAAEQYSKEGLTVKVCETAQECAEGADIICTTSSSRTPFLNGDWVKAGAHVNMVGMGKEIEDNLLLKGHIYPDVVSAVLRDSANEKELIASGKLDPATFGAEIGKIINGEAEGRQSDDEITLFETVGLSVEDLAAAALIAEKAEKLGVGVLVEF